MTSSQASTRLKNTEESSHEQFAVTPPSYSPEAQQIVTALEKEDIFAYGTPETTKFEKRLERALLRSYRQALKTEIDASQLGVLSKEGPLAEETEKLMASHYDERAEFFCNFLDTSYMAYSMAYYGETAEEICNTPKTLEEAQTAKFELICERAQIKGDEKVFNLGCGFGSLEKYLLRTYPNIDVTGITPSAVQIEYLRGQMEDPESILSCGRFKLIEGNFDSVSLETLGAETYDVVFSVGVLEHIKNVKRAFERIALMLKSGGRSFHHLIASDHIIPRFLDAKKTRIDEYFPGGRVWPFAELATHNEHIQFEESWYLNGRNYWRTLDEWHKRFWQNISNISGPEFDSERVKHWNDYFCLCKIVFSPMNGDMVGNGHYLYRKA